MNKINITSNRLDQAPKTTNAGYQKRLDAIKDEFYKAFDQFVDIDGDESITNWLDTYQTLLPLRKINLLKNGEALAIQLKREPAGEERGGRNEAPSMPKDKRERVFSPKQNIKLHKIKQYHSNQEKKQYNSSFLEQRIQDFQKIKISKLVL